VLIEMGAGGEVIPEPSCMPPAWGLVEKHGIAVERYRTKSRYEVATAMRATQLDHSTEA
jgi:hypothetical protein